MPYRRPAQQGFTLLELLVVVAIMALVVGGFSLTLPSAAERRLQQEGARLAALLEVERARARSLGQRVVAEVAQGQLVFVGMGPRVAQPWLHADTQAVAARVSLGPEPVIAAQTVVLLGDEGRQLQVHTDGVRPFSAAALP